MSKLLVFINLILIIVAIFASKFVVNHNPTNKWKIQQNILNKKIEKIKFRNSDIPEVTLGITSYNTNGSYNLVGSNTMFRPERTEKTEDDESCVS